MADYTAEPQNIRLSADERAAIGRLIRERTDAARDQKGSMPDGWWKQVEMAYRGEKPGQDEDEAIDQIRMPHGIRPRTDTLLGQLATVIVRQDPYMRVAGGVPAEVARRKEKIIHRLWADGGFPNAVASSGVPAILLNKAILRCYPEYGDYTGRPGICIDAIHPQDFFPYPAALRAEQWSQVGNRTWRRIRSVKDKMRSGAWFDITGKIGKKLDASDPSEYDETGAFNQAGTCLANMSPEDDDETTRIDIGQTKLDLSNLSGLARRQKRKPKDEVWYRYVLAYDSSELLALSPYRFTYSEYFDEFLIPDLLMYWSGNSLGRAAFPLQDMGDKLWSTFYTMAQNAAKRLIVGPGAIDGSSHVTADWGEYYGSDEIEQPTSFAITPELQPILLALQEIQRLLDINFRISQNTMGTVQGRDTKATTDSIIAAGVQTGLEQLLSNFTSSYGRMAQHTEEIALHLIADLTEHYGEEWFGAPIEQVAQELSQRANWEVTGRSPNSTPDSRIQHAMVLMKAAEDPEYGYDKYVLGGVLAKEGPLAGVEGVQKTREQMAAEAEAIAKAEQDAQAQAMNAQRQMQEQERNARSEDAADQRVHDVVGKLVDAAVRPVPAGATNGAARKPRKGGASAGR